MSSNLLSTFNPFKTYAKLSWYDDNPVIVKLFSYQLSQYSPSIYAELLIIIDSDNFNDFKNIDSFSIQDRLVDVWFEPELYHPSLNMTFFPGPFQFCVIQYEFTNFPLSDLDLSYSNYNTGKVISLKCIDPIFYQMTLDQKITDFPKSTISDVVKKIVSNNGSTLKEFTDTDYAYNWLQLQMTDYEMIRSMLPYSRATDKSLLYTFFMMNKEAYFAPIGTSNLAPIKFNIDMIKNAEGTFKTFDMKPFIEKYGSIDSLYSTHNGFSNFENVVPTTMNKQSYSTTKNENKQHKGIATRYVPTGVEDKTLQEIYISNIRHRMHAFSRIIAFENQAIPEITPLNCIEMISEEDGNTKELDGIYYILEIKYIFGMTNKHPLIPKMILTLSSELDSKGMQKPEGKAVV